MMMVNPLRGEKQFILGEMTLTLVPSFERLAIIEDNLNLSLVTITDRIVHEKISMREQAIILSILSGGEHSAAVIGEKMLGPKLLEVRRLLVEIFADIFGLGKET
jgi:hypothetical protein